MALVYDVGMHHGEDTTYYLSKGYSVVAIEAVPEFVESSAQRFQREIERGRLVILNVALADHAGTAEFWVCDDLSEWSSFHETLAGRDDKNHHRITVNTTRFKDVLRVHGRAEYIKIDIEGSDWLCLSDIDDTNAPRFISAESECGGSQAQLAETQYLAIIRLMRERGYNRFKLVNQHTLVPVWRSSLDLAFDASYRERLRQQIENQNAWQFVAGSSGPFGDAIPGPWMEFSEAVDVYGACRERFFRDYDGVPIYWFWFDWHATRVG